jgi:hypothetical protein
MFGLQDAAAPNVVRLSFQVDTNCACMMHVYYNAEESFERGGALKCGRSGAPRDSFDL